MPRRSIEITSADAAKEAALRFLERAPRTEREIVDRLLARGFVPDAVERAVERLRRVSLLDDRAFVRSFLRTELARRPQGRRMLTAKLKRRGVPAPIVEDVDALVHEDPDLVERGLDTEEGRAKAALVGLTRRHRQKEGADRARRIGGALARLGFDWSIVRDLVTYGDSGERERH
ncbi:MAG: regulatory protein RecX [Candidatus Eiseniibacteriota bacterium]